MGFLPFVRVRLTPCEAYVVLVHCVPPGIGLSR